MDTIVYRYVLLPSVDGGGNTNDKATQIDIGSLSIRCTGHRIDGTERRRDIDDHKDANDIIQHGSFNISLNNSPHLQFFRVGFNIVSFPLKQACP